MRYNLLKHISHNFTTLSRNITSQHNTFHSFSHHSRTKRPKHNITKLININKYTSIMQLIRTLRLKTICNVDHVSEKSP